MKHGHLFFNDQRFWLLLFFSYIPGRLMEKNPENDRVRKVTFSSEMGPWGTAFLNPAGFPGTHLSNEKHLGWLGYIGDYTTQLYRAL